MKPILLKILLSTLSCYVFMTSPVHAAPVVVELFTSQGCSSCPPADEFLAELKEFGDILPLSFHVTYWNQIGWTDPYSSEASTARQKAYRDAFTGQLYTPQIIIHGVYQAIGSSRQDVLEKVAEVKSRAAAEIPVSVTRTDSGLLVSLPATGLTPKKPHQVWLVAYDEEHTTPIGAGENNGRSLRNVNVVRAIQPLAEWDGQGRNLVIPREKLPPATQNIAVLVQEANMGPVLAAAVVPVVSGSVLNNVQIDPTIDPSIGFNQPTHSQNAQKQQIEAVRQQVQQAEKAAQESLDATRNTLQQEFAKPPVLPPLPSAPEDIPSLLTADPAALPASILPESAPEVMGPPLPPAPAPSLLDSLPPPAS